MKKVKRRITFSETEKRKIFNKTNGICHFCGDELVFEKRGKRLEGYWEVDHIRQISKKGDDAIENVLPICSPCNRMRWFNKGDELRYIYRLGLVAKDEIEKNTEIGSRLNMLYEKRENQKKSRTIKYKVVNN